MKENAKFFLLVSLYLLAMPILAGAQKTTPLAPPPDWSRLGAYQYTLSRSEFSRELSRVYAPRGASRPYIEIGRKSVSIRQNSTSPRRIIEIPFARLGQRHAPPRYWRPRSEMPPAKPGKPLLGIHIAIDPGHIGGKWAKMEERWFRLGSDKPVLEGELTLGVARLLEKELTSRGARVTLVRRNARPVTSLRPHHLEGEARAYLRENFLPIGQRRVWTVEWQSQRLFYRTAEIHARAAAINQKIQPDLVLALHFNAESWGDPARPTLTTANHMHLLINGCYSLSEMSYDDVRFEMLLRLFQGIHSEELAIAQELSRAMQKNIDLPPYLYRGSNAKRASNDEYIYLRNLLANRIYHCPVLYLEPYVMNSREDYARIQAGAYRGARSFGGRKRSNIFAEYARAVADGLTHYYGNR